MNKIPVRLLFSILLKLASAALAGIFLLALLTLVLQTASGDTGYDLTPAEGISRCESALQARDYAALLDHLTLFDLYGEEFDPYWEIAAAYQQFVLCLQHSAGEAAGLSGAAGRRADAYDRLAALAASAAEQRNAALFADFLAQADAFAAAQGAQQTAEPAAEEQPENAAAAALPQG